MSRNHTSVTNIFNGSIQANGVGNNFGGLTGSDEDKERAIIEWMIRHESTAQTPYLDEGTFSSDLGASVLQSAEFQRCFNLSGQTVVYEGQPGVGKTTLMVHLTRKLAEVHTTCSTQALAHSVTDVQSEQTNFRNDQSLQNAVIASVFFRADVQISENPDQYPFRVLMLLLHQFVKCIPGRIDHVRSLYEKHPNSMPPAKAIADTMIRVLNGDVKACIFLDALDECYPPYLADLMEQIERVQRRTMIGLFMTDRIEASVRTSPSRKSTVEPITKTLRSMKSDMTQYLDNRMEKLEGSRLYKWVQQPRLRKKCKDVIIKASGDIFLLIKLNFDFAHQAPDEDKLISNLDAIEEMKNENGKGNDIYLKEVLCRAYRRNLDRILSSSNDWYRVKQARLILAFLRDACRPLSAPELLEMLGVETKKGRLISPTKPCERTVVELSCEGLVVFGKGADANTVGYLHHSLLHYLEEDEDERTRIPDTTEKLGKSCVAYLTSGFSQGGVCQDLGSLGRRIEGYPLLDYAARYWWKHLQKFYASNPDGLTNVCSTSDSFQDLAFQFLANDESVESATQIMLFPDKYLPPTLQRLHHSSQSTKWFVKFLLDKGSGHTRFHPTQTTGVHIACKYGFDTLVNNLIKRWPKRIAIQDYNGWSPLHHAIPGGYVQVVQTLLEAGANLQCRALNGITPLMLASRLESADIVEMLIQKDPSLDLNALNGSLPDIRPEVMASEHEVIFEDGQLYVSDLAHTELPVLGRTALQEAALCGRENVIEKLLNKPGIDMELQDSEGRTALHTAVKHGHIKAVKVLLKHGADPYHKVYCSTDGSPSSIDSIKNSRYQNSLLHVACKYDRNRDVACHLLKEYPEFLNQTNARRETPLHVASSLAGPDLVELLLGQHGVVVNSQDTLGNTPLHNAVRRREPDATKITELLLQHPGVKVNTLNNEYHTAEHFAAKSRHEVHETLLSKHLDKEQRVL